VTITNPIPSVCGALRGLQVRAFDFDRHQLRLLFAQAAQQIARSGDSDQSEHDGHADHQMRIHDSLVLPVIAICRTASIRARRECSA
jgi:hypothetical protein